MNPVQGRMVRTGRGVWIYKSLREVPEETRAGDRYGTYILYTYYRILYSFIQWHSGPQNSYTSWKPLEHLRKKRTAGLCRRES